MRDDKFGHAPLVSIVTVTFNSADHIRGCIASVSRSVGTTPIEHIVIDNASRDETSALVRAEFPDVVLVESTVNRGLTAANNDRRNGNIWFYVSHRSRASAGVAQPRVFRGRALRVAAIAARVSALCTLGSGPFGKYWRSNPLVFSLAPRCQGL